MSYLVVGQSIAGIAAARALRAMGQPVYLTPHEFDTVALDDWYLIGPTDLNEFPQNGSEWEVSALSLLQKEGVTVSGRDSSWDFAIDELLVSGSQLVVYDYRRRSELRVRGLIFAPNGSQPTAVVRRPYLRGVSNSAIADAPIVRGRPVVVMGGGGYALQQTCIALDFASEVTLCCPTRWPETENPLAERLLRHAQNSKKLTILPNCDWVETVASSHTLERVRVRQDARIVEIEAPLLIFAYGPVPIAEFGTQGKTLSDLPVGRFAFPAGIARSIRCMEHQALYQSGVMAAQQAVRAAGNNS